MGLASAEYKFTFVDLFAGLGGFHQAASRFGGKCVLASEINPLLRELYRSNFDVAAHGDIRDVPIADVPDHDVLFAGFPCQPFSKAGKQMGWEDAVRGTLFENIVNIVKAKAPKVLIMENVAHFVRHDDGQTYEKVQNALRAIGYRIDYKQMSPHQFSVPHIRERIYMVASKKSLDGFSWPNPDASTTLDISTILDTRPAEAIPLSSQVEACLDLWQEFLDLIPVTTKLPSFPIWSMEAGADYPITRKNLVSYTSGELAS